MSRRFPAVYKALNVVHEHLFTWSRGRIFGSMLGMTCVRLTTTGNKTGLERVTMITSPLVEDDEVVLVASFRGGPKHPAWYLNLRATPTIPIIRRGFDGLVTAQTLSGAEREAMFERIDAVHKRYRKYQSRTDRELPIVVLRPAEREKSLLVSKLGVS